MNVKDKKIKKIIFDIETNGLRPDKIWCCVCQDPDTGEFSIFHDGDAQACQEYFSKADQVIGHNIIMFDLPVLEKLWNVHVPVKKIYDTVVMSRLADPKREGGHTLRSWGERLGNYKGDYEDWSHWTPEMEEYCKQDVRVTGDIYKALQKELRSFSKISQGIEMRSQWVLSKQYYNGFDFDLEGAIKLKNKMTAEYLVLIDKIQQVFKPRKVFVGQYNARRKKDGTLTAKSAEIISRPFVEPSEIQDVYNVYEYKEFSIDSPSEIVERMKPYWHPVIYNRPSDKHPDRPPSPKVCPENLETVGEDAPEEIQSLVRTKVLKSRSTLVQSFIDAVWEDGRLHGDVFSVGASSNRMSHRNPNTANIPSGGSLYGEDCRKLFKAPEGCKIVGCDAAGIQLRALAHYVEDPDLIHQILHGDIHVHLAKIYGLIPADAVYDENDKHMKLQRKRGKTITYSILMGAGADKVGQLAGGDAKLGRAIMKRLSSGIKGWDRFKNNIKTRAMKGFFKAIDGRCIRLPNAHKGMSFYLQSFEQAVVKWVMWKSYNRLTEAGIPFKQVAVVHDEIQYEIPEEYADKAGKIVEGTFSDATDFFKTKCPLAGEYLVGATWNESH